MRYLRSGTFLFSAASFLSVIFFHTLSFCADTGSYEQNFFSGERFLSVRSVGTDIKGAGKVRRDLKRFSDIYKDGTDALTAGRLKDARSYFLEAREIWPEYFGTDFLLARVYEDLGKYPTAARYYKSYLNKLKNYRAGQYRISAPLIKTLVPSGIEEYDTARALIWERLNVFGIDLAKVRPAMAVPAFLVYVFMFAVFGIVYYAFARWALPNYREQKRLRNPPEGFWASRKCHTMNSELNKVCEYCGERPER